MTQISKYPVTSQVYDKIFDVFLRTISGFSTKKQLNLFLQDFLTPTEKVMLAKRLAIAFLLEKGYDYRQISKILRVSTSTIRSVSLDLKFKNNFKKVIGRIKKEEDIELFLKDVGKNVAKVLAMGGAKAGTWKYIRRELEDKGKKKPF